MWPLPMKWSACVPLVYLTVWSHTQGLVNCGKPKSLYSRYLLISVQGHKPGVGSHMPEVVVPFNKTLLRITDCNSNVYASHM